MRVAGNAELFLEHLPIVGAVSAATGIVAGLVASAPVGDHPAIVVAIVVGAVAGLLAACGAVVSVVQGAPDAVDVLSMTTPEIAGSRTVVRTAWPPGLAVLGVAALCLSAVGLRRAPLPHVAFAAVLVAVAVAVVVGVRPEGWPTVVQGCALAVAWAAVLRAGFGGSTPVPAARRAHN